MRPAGCPMLGHFYPRPPRGGRRQRASKSRQRASISIHALREEGDADKGDDQAAGEEISIHALREEGDQHSGTR